MVSYLLDGTYIGRNGSLQEYLTQTSVKLNITQHTSSVNE